MAKNSVSNFALRLLQWFDLHGRHDLPWQQDITPYRVWVSEIMLQQTQVSTVIPYYQAFMHSFPSVHALANASEDDVLHHWSGLGYYARARNLHKAAKMVVENGGEFPIGVEVLVELPGIGRSTAGAIASIAQNQYAAILDGNVKRVLARHQAIEGWAGQAKVADKLWLIAEAETPKKRTADYTQAIMDLGATLCTRSKPLCNFCPVSEDCLALATNSIADYPGKKPKKVMPVKQTQMLILQNKQGDVLLKKRPASGIWGGLWSLPELEGSVEDWVQQQFQQTAPSHSWPVMRHTFSHYHLDIQPIAVQLSKESPQIMEGGQQLWYNSAHPEQIGLAAPVKKLIDALFNDPLRQSHTNKGV